MIRRRPGSAARRHGMALLFIDLACGHIENPVPARPPLLDAAALRAGGGALVWIVGLQPLMYPATPLFGRLAAAVLPALGTVDLVHHEPQKEAAAAAPPCPRASRRGRTSAAKRRRPAV